MRTLEEFTPLGEATADDRSRIAFGKVGVSGNERYAVAVNKHGEILLTPLASIPRREAWLWQNPGAMSMVLEGLRQSAAGETHDVGSFADYARLEIDEDEEDEPIEPLVPTAPVNRATAVDKVFGTVQEATEDAAEVVKRAATGPGDFSLSPARAELPWAYVDITPAVGALIQPGDVAQDFRLLAEYLKARAAQIDKSPELEELLDEATSDLDRAATLAGSTGVEGSADAADRQMS